MKLEDAYTVIPGLVRIISNVDTIPYFSFGSKLYRWAKSKDSKINIFFGVANKVDFSNTLDKKFGFFHGNFNTDEIYFCRPLMRRIKAKLILKDLNDIPKVLVNNIYYRFVRFQIENVYPPGIHLTNIIIAKMLNAGYAPLFAGAVVSNGKAVLISAPSGTGKTLTTFLALKCGFKYLSEDIAVIDGKYAYATPHTSSYYKPSIPVPILSHFLSRPPPNGVLNFLRSRLVEKAEIKKIVILEYGNKEIEEIDREKALGKLIIINRAGFLYYKDPLLLAHSYFNSFLDLNKLVEKERNLLREAARRSECFVFKSRKPEEYITLLTEADL